MKHILNAALVASCWGPDANVAEDNGKDGGGAPAPGATDPAAAAPPMTSADIAKAVQDGIAAGMEAAFAKAKADRKTATNNAGGPVDAAHEEANGKAPAFHQNRRAIQADPDTDSLQGKGLNFGKALHTLAFCLHDKGGMKPEEAAEVLGYKSIAEGMAARRKAMGPNTLSGGGALIAPEWSSEVIPLLTPRMITRRAGIQSQPVNDELVIPKITGGTTAVWVGAGEKITSSAMAFGQLKLHSHKLAVFLGFPNEWFRKSSVGVDALVRNDFLRSAGLKEDITYIRGAGSANSPRGIRYLVDAATNIAGITGTTVDAILNDLYSQIGMVEDNDVPLDRCVWFCNPRTKRKLANLRDNNNQFIFRDELKGPNPTLLGFPLFTTSQIPKNLGGGANESEIYFGNVDTAMIGDGMNVEIGSSDSATWEDEDGGTNNAFQQDQTVMRLLLERDFILRYDKGFSVRTGVTY